MGLIEPLVAEKLIVRTPSAVDRRRVLIQLTDRGEVVLEKLTVAHREQLKRLGPEICQLLKRLRRGDASA